MPSKKQSILIIDDNPSILRTFTRLLNKAGYALDTAKTVKIPLEKFTTRSFDAALIDVGLGKTKGTDLLPQMQKVPSKMLRIVLTGTPMPWSMLNEARRSADVFLLKPVKPEMLLEIFEEKLKRWKK